MTTAVAQRATTICDRVLAPTEGDVSADHARYLLRLGFTPADHQRMAELAEKANEGLLNDTELAELDDYILVSHLIGRLQSFARVALRRAAGGG